MPASIWTSLVYAILICSSPFASLEQQTRNPQLPAPPLMKFVSRDERSQLTATRDPKSRIKTTIELAEDHLASAERFTSQKKFDRASEELGSYLGLIDDAREFIASMNRDKNSTRDLYRHLDISLRAHMPRLAVMRRTTPAEYAVNIKAAEQHTRDTRTEALESFYGHTVLREDSGEKKPNKPKDQPEENKRP